MREFKELGYDRWREERGYGVRWRVESLFSAVKRTFGFRQFALETQP